MTLRETMQDFLGKAAAVRARGFEYAARMAVALEASPTGAELEKLDTIARQFEDVRKLLGRGLSTAFEQAGQTLPDKLQTSAAEAQKAVTRMTAEIVAARSLLDKGALNREKCQQLVDIQSEHVFPAVSETLELLQAALTSAEAEAGRANKTLIKSAVSEIDDINSVINLISVNASVEAARAGPAGRGFAVIASEIQSLSHRSQQAVSNIRSQLR